MTVSNATREHFPSPLLWEHLFGHDAVAALKDTPTRSLDLFVSQLHYFTNETSDQTWIKLKPYFARWPLVILIPEDASWTYQAPAIEWPRPVAIGYQSSQCILSSPWNAVNCWHRWRRFVSIKHKHPDVHFSDLGSQLTANISGSALFLAHPHTFLIYHIWMEIMAININDK